MSVPVRCFACILALLFAESSAYAGPCSKSIVKAQIQVDAVVEANARASDWKPESPRTLRGHQPTPRSLAQAEGNNGAQLETALDALNQARAADQSDNSTECRRQLASVRVILRHLQR